MIVYKALEKGKQNSKYDMVLSEVILSYIKEYCETRKIYIEKGYSLDTVNKRLENCVRG